VSISTSNLCIGYGSTVVQRDLTFSLHAGEMVCMLGPNGCGKSTLLRTLAGLQPALSGECTHGDAKNIALVLTERLSMDNTTVHDVVALGRYPYTSFLGGLTDEDEAIIAESLRQVGFDLSTFNFNLSFFNAHSDGEKQRILIAKALAQQTPIILLDEPTAHLDLPHRILILRLLRTLAHEQGKTVLISTHELDLALALSDRILLMSKTANDVSMNGVKMNGVSENGHSTCYLDTAENLKKANAFTSAFSMDIFNPLG
jgi:iron complex transport system ATP-binding protein